MELNEIELSKFDLPLLIAFSQVEEIINVDEDLIKINYDYENQKTIYHDCRITGTKSAKNTSPPPGGKKTGVDRKNEVDDSKTVK